MSGPVRRRRTTPEPNSEKNTLRPNSIDKLSLITKSSRLRSSNYLLKKRMIRASKQIQGQDENNVPHAAKTVVKESFKICVSTSSLNSLKNDSKNKNTAPPVTSSVLRDKTNEVSDLSKTDLSPIVVLPNQRGSTKKLDVIIPKLDQFTFGANSDTDKKENIQIIHVSKAIEDNSQEPLKDLGLPVKRISRTRSAQSITDGNKILKDALLPKTKKFFKSGNSNTKLTKLLEKQSIKGHGRKRKIVKKNIRDSTVSFIVNTPEKCSLGEKKNLRPRQELKNYCEESKLLEQLSPRKRKSIVVIDKLPDPNAKKLPIWKSIKFRESEPKGKDVYELFEPQPGPSSLQRQPFHEAEILRQTNLNNFFNRDDTPGRTKIRTSHGIFDDMHSTPINVKPLKKIWEPNVQNAFGFDDDDFDVSPIPSENIEPVILPSREVLQLKVMKNRNTKQKVIGTNPMRLSPKEILKTLQKRHIEKEIRTKREDKVENNKLDQSGEEHENKEENQKNDRVEKLSSETNFSDTFDLMEDHEVQKYEQTNKNESTSLPLFADLEPPTHFVTPPKSIYKRKRAEKFNSSERSEDEENSDVENKRMKKMVKKACKEDKKLNEWAKNVNKTFAEIDNFELVVE